MQHDDIDDGGPAFPQPLDDMGTLRAKTEGMSLRDYFAGPALTGVLTTIAEMTPEAQNNVAVITRDCYTMADAMLAARTK